MKVLALVLSTVISVTIVLVAAIMLALATPDISLGLYVLAILGITAIMFGPLVLGSLSFYWDFSRSVDARGYLRRAVIIIGSVQLAAIGAVIVFAVLSGTSPLVPAGTALVGVVLMVIAPLLGRALRRHEDRRGPATPTWLPVEPFEIRRKIRAIVITFAITLVISVGGILLLFLGLSGKSHASALFGGALLLGLSLACIAAAFAGILVVLPVGRSMRAATGNDISLTRTVAKVVLRGKTIELSHDDERAAARYAAAAAVYFPFYLSYLVLFFLGLTFQRVSSLMQRNGIHPLFDWILIACLAIVLIVTLPLMIVRTLRARRYAQKHAELLVPDADNALQNDPR